MIFGIVAILKIMRFGTVAFTEVSNLGSELRVTPPLDSNLELRATPPLDSTQDSNP